MRAEAGILVVLFRSHEGVKMKRRQFLNAFGCALVSKPLFALAQQQGKVPLVGILDTDATAKFEPFKFGAFDEVLRDRGWINGATVRWKASLLISLHVTALPPITPGQVT